MKPTFKEVNISLVYGALFIFLYYKIYNMCFIYPIKETVKKKVIVLK